VHPYQQLPLLKMMQRCNRTHEIERRHRNCDVSHPPTQTPNYRLRVNGVSFVVLTKGALVRFEDTPKAFANCSPGLLQPRVQGQDRPNAESVR
jgi:hypothetical protein